MTGRATAAAFRAELVDCRTYCSAALLSPGCLESCKKVAASKAGFRPSVPSALPPTATRRFGEGESSAAEPETATTARLLSALTSPHGSSGAEATRLTACVSHGEDALGRSSSPVRSEDIEAVCGPLAVALLSSTAGTVPREGAAASCARGARPSVARAGPGEPPAGVPGGWRKAGAEARNASGAPSMPCSRPDAVEGEWRHGAVFSRRMRSASPAPVSLDNSWNRCSQKFTSRSEESEKQRLVVEPDGAFVTFEMPVAL